LIGLLTAISVMSYVARSNISVAAKFIKPEFGLTDVQMGWVFSSFIIGYSLFQVPAGRLGDKFGPRLVLALAALSWGIMSLLTGFVPGMVIPGSIGVLGTFLVLRFLLGAGEAATYPVAARAISDWLPPTERARANAIVITGSMLGSALTPPLIAWAMTNLGWRQSFYLTAVMATVVSIVWWVFIRDREFGTRSEPTRADSLRPAVVPWKALFTNRNILLVSLSYFVEGWVLYIFVFWLYTYLVDVRHFSILKGGVFAALPWLVASVLTPLGGVLSDRLSLRFGESLGRRAVAMSGFILSAIFLWCGATVGNPYVAIAALGLAVGFVEFTEGTFWATTSNIAGVHAGAATGIMNTMGNLGGVASTMLVPVLVKYFGWVVALGSGSVLAVLAALLWLAIDLKPTYEEAA
jgi:ACS family glucarate transporter-like MFS transporter